MAKSKSSRRGGRRGGSPSPSNPRSDGEDHPHPDCTLDRLAEPQTFKQRQDLRRKNAAEVHKSKMKCHACGRPGHSTRDCPAGAAARKPRLRGGRGGKRRGGSGKRSSDGNAVLPPCPFPPSAIFNYYDASSSPYPVITSYLAGLFPGREREDPRFAETEYLRASHDATPRYGGCIMRRTGADPPLLVFVPVGGGSCSALDRTSCPGSNGSVVGYFSDLIYVRGDSPVERTAQRDALALACRAASEAGTIVQVRISPLPSRAGEEEENSPHKDALRDLAEVLLAATSEGCGPVVHLSRWSGRASNLVRLLEAFPKLYVGMDATVSFSKAVELHECAFEVPPDRLLIETGHPSTVPASVAKAGAAAGGSLVTAWCHAGTLPFIAEAIAEKRGGVTAADVARICGENTLRIYGLAATDC